jgi:hypothetical protein
VCSLFGSLECARAAADAPTRAAAVEMLSLVSSYDAKQVCGEVVLPRPFVPRNSEDNRAVCNRCLSPRVKYRLC